MPEFLELEETVGKRWHRIIGHAPTYKTFPEHGVALDSMRGAILVFFRGLGGGAGVGIGGIEASSSKHRLTFRQRLGFDTERVLQPRFNGNTLFLPSKIEVFPNEDLNRRLYFWLAAYFAHSQFDAGTEADLLCRDLHFLQRVHRTLASIFSTWDGLRRLYGELGAAFRDLRPPRRLPPVENDVEQVILRLLGGKGNGGRFWPLIAGQTEIIPLPLLAKRYKSFLPVPLWGEMTAASPEEMRTDSTEAPCRGNSDARDGQTRKGKRHKSDQTEREDSLILNRFEKILTLIESININRSVDDDDEDNARKALDDAEEIGISSHKGKPSTRLRFDLDLPPNALDDDASTAVYDYPEWHYAKKIYLPNYCRVIAGEAPETGERWSPDPDIERLVRQVRRQFETLRPRYELMRGQLDGAELDIEALVRARCDLRATGVGSDRIYRTMRPQGHDLAVMLLTDISLSTDGWIDNRRVLDVEKEALTVLAHGLAACGVDYEIATFTSRRRNWVRFDIVKNFDEPLSATVNRRIAAIKPGYYTRIGAALRHASHRLNQRSNRHRLLILLTDGKPNDIDHYEGRYGVEDTRRAAQEARRAGAYVFGVTVDREAQDYFPVLFGRGGYAIVNHISRLPTVLPSLYRHLVN